jgi:signal transduction histidine kinase
LELIIIDETKLSALHAPGNHHLVVIVEAPDRQSGKNSNFEIAARPLILRVFTDGMRKQILFIVFLAVVAVHTTHAITKEYIDSVKTVLDTTKSNRTKLKCLYTLSYEYGLIEPRKGIAYGRQMLQLALEEKDLFSQLNAYNGQANAYETLGNFDSAAYLHHCSYEIAKQMKSPRQMGLTLFNVALCLKQLGDYRNALDKYVRALKMVERRNDYNCRMHFYLGEMYLITEDIKNAELQSRLGIKKALEFNHRDIINIFYVNLARCYLKRGEADSAISILDTTLINVRKHTDRINIGICLNALGECYAAKKNFGKALQFFEEELALQEEIKNVNGAYMASLNMANTAAHARPLNIGRIRAFLERAEKEFPHIQKNYDILTNGYYKAGEAYELIGDHTKALSYYKQYYALKDSLLSKERLWQLSELQTQYETAKKENEIKDLKQTEIIRNLELAGKNAAIRQKNVVIVLGIFLFVLTGALIWFFAQRKKLQNRLGQERVIKATEENERLRIARDIHDDLGSGLSKINFLSELIIRDKELKPGSAENAAAIAETSRKLVVSMKDLIWALNPENTTLSGLLARIREHSSDYLEDFQAELKLLLPESVAASAITKESHRQVLMTVKESLNNIVKHSGATLVEIEAVISERLFAVQVKDNGVGIAENVRTGNGLGNMRMRIESIGGSFTIGSNGPKGTLVAFSVPIGKMLRS